MTSESIHAHHLHHSRPSYLHIAAVYFVGIFVRAAGVSWGGKNMDEFINKAVRLLSGELQPADFFYPQLTSIVSAIACGMMFVFGRFLGVIDSIHEFQELYFTSDDAFRVAARLAHSSLAALVGPISFLTARHLGFRRSVSLVIGLCVSITPASVWFSHFAKPQNGMSMAFLAATAFAVAYLTDLDRRRLAAGIGISAGVAVAFMQSAVLPLIPLGIATVLGGATDPRVRPQKVYSDAGIALAFAVPTWALFSILDLLYLSSFIEYQILQSQLSLRSGGSITKLISHALPAAASITQGLGPVGVLLVPAAAALSRIRSIQWLSVALMLGGLLLAWSVGDRVMPRLFLPYTLSLTLLSCLSYASLTREHNVIYARIGWIGLIGLLASNMWGSQAVMRQALSTPASKLVGGELRKIVTPKGPLTMSAEINHSGLPPSQAAIDMMYARHLRLAEKYNIEMPERSENRRNFLKDKGGYPVIETPWVIGGLEYTKPEDVKVVKPYAWPVQYEEWKLDYWLDKGVMVYVLRELEHNLSDVAPKYSAEFHQEIVDRCKRVAYINPERPLFFEREYFIFDCRQEPEQRPAKSQSPDTMPAPL